MKLPLPQPGKWMKGTERTELRRGTPSTDGYRAAHDEIAVDDQNV